MKDIRTYTVKDVARMASVSVRTLHYYHEIGLLVPADRSRAGYRLYDEASLFRLQQIKIGQALGLSLEEIRQNLDDPEFDQVRALKDQREKLEAQAQTTARMIAAIDAALERLGSERRGNAMTLKDIFDGFDPDDYATEAESHWGNSTEYKISMHRTRSYKDDEWQQIKAEQDLIYGDVAAAMAADKPVDHAEVRDLVMRHRQSIDRWFYPCDIHMQLNLAALYESDDRFAANIDKHGEGLTAYLVKAIRSQAESFMDTKD